MEKRVQKENLSRTRARQAAPAARDRFKSSQTDRVIKEKTFDITEIWRIIRKHLFMYLVVILVCAMGYGIGRSYFDPPKYASNATIFLTPKFDSKGDLDQTSVSTNRTLLNNAIALMTRENIMAKVAENIGNMTPDEIRETLRVSAVEGTELISINATTTDPQLSKTIVDSTISVFISTMQENLNLNNITVVDQPKLNFQSVSTPITVYMAQGAAVGALLDAVQITFVLLFDKRLKTKEEAERYLEIPVFVVLPDLEKK